MRRATRAVVFGLSVLAAVVLTTGGAAFAQPAEAVRPAYAQLQARIAQRYQVVTLRRGLVLVPKQAQTTYSNIEISDDGAVLVDGSAVTGRELRARVPADADLIAQLSFLSAEERRSLFAKAAPAEGAQAAKPESAPAEPETTARTEEPRPEEGWVERERYRRGGARVRVGGDVWVKEDEVAGDAVVAVFGTARVDGRVDGDVVAVGGSVHLGPKSDVRGNVVAVGGSVERQPGSRVQGDLNEVRVGFPSIGPWFHVRPWQGWHWFGGTFGASTDLLATLLRMALVALFAAMIAAVAATPVRRVAGVVATEPFRAGIAGLAAQIFFVPVLVITVVVLAVSIVGIPLLLLVPFGVLAFVLALFLGFAGTGCAVGNLMTRRTGRSVGTVFVSLAVGLAVIWALTMIARFGGLAGQPVRVLLGVVLLAGFVVEYAAWTVGLGAVLISRFGRRGPLAPADPPPPVPELEL